MVDKSQKQKAFRVNVVRQQNAALVQKMSIPATSSNSAEAIKQTPAAITESVALEQPDEPQGSAPPTLDQEMVESYEQIKRTFDLVLDDGQIESRRYNSHQVVILIFKECFNSLIKFEIVFYRSLRYPATFCSWFCRRG